MILANIIFFKIVNGPIDRYCQKKDYGLLNHLDEVFTLLIDLYFCWLSCWAFILLNFLFSLYFHQVSRSFLSPVSLVHMSRESYFICRYRNLLDAGEILTIILFWQKKILMHIQYINFFVFFLAINVFGYFILFFDKMSLFFKIILKGY
jgi:hypothetical protein